MMKNGGFDDIDFDDLDLISEEELFGDADGTKPADEAEHADGGGDPDDAESYDGEPDEDASYGGDSDDWEDGGDPDEEYDDGEPEDRGDRDKPAKSAKKGAPKGKKKKNGNKGISILLIVVLVVCVVGVGVAIYQLTHIQLQYKAAEDEYDDLLQYVYEEPDETDDGEDNGEEDEGDEENDEEVVERVAISLLKQQNADTVGWIEIPGTTISYPVMHTTDNSYYLTHTFSGKTNSSGCIFVETLNSGDFTDLHTIIYGHNMNNGSMFASLKNYSSASYLVAHPTIYIDLEDGTHAYQIFSVHTVNSDNEVFTIGFARDDEYAAFLEMLKESSDYDTGVSVTTDDDIITLSTCTNSGVDRYVVHAKKLY